MTPFTNYDCFGVFVVDFEQVNATSAVGNFITKWKERFFLKQKLIINSAIPDVN